MSNQEQRIEKKRKKWWHKNKEDIFSYKYIKKKITEIISFMAEIIALFLTKDSHTNSVNL